ncbi:MAG: hypothetical protein RLN70_10760, partial [Rhodospirillaceae bacterium]
RGALNGGGHWLGAPFSISSNEIRASTAELSVTELDFASPNAVAGGSLIADLATGAVSGSIAGNIPDLTPLANVLGFEMAGQADIEVVFDPIDGTQRAVIDLQVRDVVAPGFAARALSAGARIN